MAFKSFEILKDLPRDIAVDTLMYWLRHSKDETSISRWYRDGSAGKSDKWCMWYMENYHHGWFIIPDYIKEKYG